MAHQPPPRRARHREVDDRPLPSARAPGPIVAVATAPGRGAIGIVRASGPDLAPLIDAVCRRPLAPRQAALVAFADADGRAIDHGLAIHFPAPQSATGEDVLELHAHGGAVVLQLLVERCLQAQPGMRLAAPGEFTERAFLNDKIDLAQAEAVADLIDAGTAAAARSAVRSLEGAFSAEVRALADAIVALRTLVEATLDFPDEEIDFLERAGAQAQLAALRNGVATALARARTGVRLRDGLRVVIAGQTNVGKSSLLNALAGADLAIVTPIAGTTRDRIGAAIDVDGVPLHVVDTAGLRGDATDAVERIGIERSWQAIEGADAVLFVHDLARAGDSAHAAADIALAAQLPAGVPVLHVHNKRDLTPQAAVADGGVAVSALDGGGLADLRAALLDLAGGQPAGEGAVIARARHVDALRDTQARLDAAAAHAAAGDAALELLAEELRLAHRALGTITGEFGTEDLLGAIFAGFCIGK